MNEGGSEGKRKRFFSFDRRFLIGISVIVVMTAVAVSTAGLLEIKDVAEALSHGARLNVGHEITAAEAGAPQTILVLGSDRRYQDIVDKAPARSDTILLVRMDSQGNAISVMSIPRDLKVDIPGHEADHNQADHKINAAYMMGGPELTLKVVKQLLGINVNHIVNINFGGFQRAVDYIGCVYTDIDRHYFNDNSAGGEQYATINIKAGYQKLCGKDALDFVRFRHLDNDLIRAARQQEFLRQAKAQVGVQKLIDDRRGLVKILGRYTQTDSSLHTTDALLQLIKLGVFLIGAPVREVHFPAILSGGGNDPYVHAEPAALHKTVDEFLHPPKVKSGEEGDGEKKPHHHGGHGKGKKESGGGVPAGLADDATQGQAEAKQVDRLPFPVYFPALRTSSGGTTYKDPPRSYFIRDERHRLYRAYRMVLSNGAIGEYYGVQGMNWLNPPILSHPSEKRTVHGRRFELFFDGQRLRMVAWRTPRAVYWVANTLLHTLTNKQMLAIAGSLRRSS